MSDDRPTASSRLAAPHELNADSSNRSPEHGHVPDRRLRSQRWRSVKALAAKDDSALATGLDPPHWESSSAIPETQCADVPDLDWLLDLNGLAQTAALPWDASSWSIASSQVDADQYHHAQVRLEAHKLQPLSSDISSGAVEAFLSEALPNGPSFGSGAFDWSDKCSDLGRAHTAPEPLPDPFMIAAEGIATPRAYHVTRVQSASDAAGRDQLYVSTGQGPISRGNTYSDMEMYRLLLETPHHPECAGQPVDWDLLFSGLATPPSHAAQPLPAQADAGQAGHLCPVNNIIRGPSQDFTIDPGTGQKLKFGKAMQARASQVELPSVAALFADISSKGPERQRRWSPRTPGTPKDPACAREGARHFHRRGATAVSPQSAQSVLTTGPQLTSQDQGVKQNGAKFNLKPLQSDAAPEGHTPLAKTPSGFGGITRGVIEAASMGGKRRAPVMRLEELHRVHCERKRFRGVTRSPWSLTWNSHVSLAAANSTEREVFLGSFATENSAAKAHDVAALRLQADHDAAHQVQTNFPHMEYHDGLAETNHTSIADFIVALQRHGAFESQCTSRYRGVKKVDQDSWEACYELEDEAISRKCADA